MERRGFRQSREPGRGFTILEVLIVIGVLGAIVAITIPATIQIYQGIKLKQAASDVMSIYRAARFQAIKDNEEIGVLARVPNEFVMFRGDVPDDLANDQIGGQFALPTGMSILGPGDAIPGGANSIVGHLTQGGIPGGWVVFQPDGSVEVANAPGGQAAIRMSHPSHPDHVDYREVRVAPAASGKIQILFWDGSTFVHGYVPEES